jgi:hypothetical protein
MRKLHERSPSDEQRLSEGHRRYDRGRAPPGVIRRRDGAGLFVAVRHRGSLIVRSAPIVEGDSKKIPQPTLLAPSAESWLPAGK